jgi:hypothetical protein
LTQVAEKRRPSRPKRSIRQILAARSMPIIDACKEFLSLSKISQLFCLFFIQHNPLGYPCLKKEMQKDQGRLMVGYFAAKE